MKTAKKSSPVGSSSSDTTVFIVDNDRWFAESVKGIIKEKLSNYTVCIIKNANEIFENIEKNRPNIIFLDLALGTQNGLTFLNEWASYDDLSDIDLYVLTNAADAAGTENLAPFGVRGVIDKATFSLEKIAEVLRAGD
jgi:DNA-binding NarL/FixJ family response regulator